MVVTTHWLLSVVYLALYLHKQASCNHLCENLKSYIPYYVNKNLPLVSALSRMNLVHAPHSISGTGAGICTAVVLARCNDT
jgi:hypothetical protein